ncbi:hypothetical protein [Aeromonas encheleia]|uniref:hypothetical protein n=1 Tax=Aeromonas encheleia TaxID=73010 RepID=UPI003BF6144C
MSAPSSNSNPPPGLKTSGNSCAASYCKVEPEGRIDQCVRSEFKLKPTAGFEDQWQFMRSQLLQS